MKRLRLILAGLLVALIVAAPSVALASDISGALYQGTIIISNNSSAASNVATTMTLSTADLISQGYANATLSNIAMRNSSGADIPFGPSINSTYPWCIWVNSIGANTEETAILYTGGPSMNNTKSYFPDIYGANVTDSASMEPGATYTMTYTGYLNTANGTGKYFWFRNASNFFAVSSNVSGNITATLGGTPNAVSIAGIPNGHAVVKLINDSVHMWITVLTSTTYYVSANFTAVPIPNTVDDWLMLFTSVGSSQEMPYVDNVTWEVSGVTKGSWQWQYATTFTDLSGNGNTMTPSFRAATSNANVTANMTAFAPISTAIGPAYSVASPSSFYSTNITTSGNFTYGNVTGAVFPGSAVVDAGAAAGSIPNIWLWGILGAFTMVMAGLAVSVMVRFGGAGNGELFIRMGIAIAVLGVMVALGKYDMWMIVFYLFIAGAFAMASRQYDIGASVGELNFIGFLSQSWVGLVGINRILEGSFMTSSEASQWNTLMFTQQYTIGDTFTLPIMNFSFWTEGLPNMVKWNYTFFGGNAQMIQYLLYSLTAILAFIIFGLIIGTLSRTFTR